MIVTLLLTAGGIYLSGLIAELFVVGTAPAGYQDESGFHLGTQFSGAPAEPLRKPEQEPWLNQFPADEPQYV